MTLTRQQVEDRALEAALRAIEHDSLDTLDAAAAIAAYQQALWQPLGDGEGLPADDFENVLCWCEVRRASGLAPDRTFRHITTAHSIREALSLPERQRPFWVTLISRWRFLDGPA